MAAKRSLAQLAYLGTSVALALKKPIVLTTYVYIYIYAFVYASGARHAARGGLRPAGRLGGAPLRAIRLHTSINST